MLGGFVPEGFCPRDTLVRDSTKNTEGNCSRFILIVTAFTVLFIYGMLYAQ